MNDEPSSDPTTRRRDPAPRRRPADPPASADAPSEPPSSDAPATGRNRADDPARSLLAAAGSRRRVGAPTERRRPRPDPGALVRAGAGDRRRRPRRGRPRRRERGGAGSLVAAALLSAVLASGGTVLALGATGALDRPARRAPVTAQGTNVGARQPVTIDESSATIDVAAKVSPAVVRITSPAPRRGNLGVIPATGVGSGVIYDSNGWILTNRHVVEGGDKLDVELKDGRVLEGTVYGIDTLTDLAIVKVDATDLPTAALGDSDALKVGQLVIAIGSPLGTYSNSVTSGIVSAKGRSITTDGNDDR